MAKTDINTIRQTTPTIYAYTTPNDPTKNGWVKIGYTDREAEKRIREQTHTSDTKYEILWSHDARYDGGEYFTDSDFHWFLVQNGIERGRHQDTGKPSEWFNFGVGNEYQARELFKNFVFQDYSSIQRAKEERTYNLRSEQAEAVNQTLAYLHSRRGSEFLWNAKPRFGKTLATYDFARKGNFDNILIVTNRPAIANSWYDDFSKFIKWQEPDYLFVSDADSLKGTGALSRDKYLDLIIGDITDRQFKQIAFVSLQDLKGSLHFGGSFDKLRWIADTEWDLLVIDEAHEAVDTTKTDWAFSRIIRKFTLHLSGTPFKAIANNKFASEQIFNWSYADEQEAKLNWDYDNGSNPYETLPQLNLFTFQLSKMIEEQIREGQVIGETTYDFAFDLNEFFAVEEGKTTFKHEKDVKKWLDRLTKNEKYPFSTPSLRKELKHTFWFLNRVNSAKALAKLLSNDPVFMHYEIIIAAGDGRDLSEEADDFDSNEKSLSRVRKAIAEHEYTITISVGQLTTGVTVPEWTAVMMLNNISSPALYMQSAFRSQNPYSYEEKGKYYKKENSYIFDFAPDRTLIMFDEFANNLVARDGKYSDKDRPVNIKKLLNFFPVIGEDEEGKMVALDAVQVLIIPRTILAKEVVKRGFMSNLLFANISGIFALPKEIVDNILSELPVEMQGKKVVDAEPLDFSEVNVDENGEVVVPTEIVINKTQELFGEKQYDITSVETVIDTVVAQTHSEHSLTEKATKRIVDVAMDLAKPIIVDTIKTGFDLTNAQADRVEKQVKETITEKVKIAENDNYKKQFEIRQKATEEAKKAEEQLEKEEAEQALKEIEARQQAEFVRLQEELTKTLNDTIRETIEEQKVAQVEAQAKIQAEKKKDIAMEDARKHLRGFARTIPSFLMAYGERETKLSNFDEYTPDEVFKEVTGITEEQFRFLRDGGPYIDDAGKEKYFEGHLFSEVVFNESIQEFLNLRERLADYFDDSQNEDIFNYIPPQETNQIFTPKQIVHMMVQKLEDEDPDIFGDQNKTFIDLFMKSGLYITELAKRLFNNPHMKEKISDDDERLKHIFENQLFGLAPTKIIFNIAMNYIFSFDTERKISRKNFKSVDSRPAVKEGRLEDLLAETFYH